MPLSDDLGAGLVFVSLACLVSHPAVSSAGSAPEPAAELRIETVEHAMHEGSAGKCLIELVSRSDGSKVFSKELEGAWTQLGYNAKTKDHVLGGLFELGAWLPVREIRYLSDDGRRGLRPARINKEEWFALGTATSPDGRFIAFVGTDDRHPGTSLFVFDTTRDQQTYLGTPPHPAPADSREDAPGYGQEGYWDWGGGCCDGHFVMDRRVVWFESPSVLKVDYGFDPAKKAGQRKRIKSWDLPIKTPQGAGGPGPLSSLPVPQGCASGGRGRRQGGQRAAGGLRRQAQAGEHAEGL